MPRVVPSQVVAVLDRMFDWAAREGHNAAEPHRLTIGSFNSVATLVGLVRQIPEELITVTGDRHIGLLAAMSALEAAIQGWQAGTRFQVETVSGFGLVHPIKLIRRALAECPDEAAAGNTMELAFIGEIQLRDSIRLDISAAYKDLAQGEWKGATSPCRRRRGGLALVGLAGARA